MKVKLAAVSLFSFGLLMYLASQQIYFPVILIPFIGFAISVFLWPQPNELKRKAQSKGYEHSDPDTLDVAGKSIKGLKNKRDNDSDFDI